MTNCGGEVSVGCAMLRNGDGRLCSGAIHFIQPAVSACGQKVVIAQERRNILTTARDRV